MSTPALAAWQDQNRRAMTDAIRSRGCWNTYVSDEVVCACCAAVGNRAQRRAAGRRGRGRHGRDSRSPFCYTTGMFGVGHPELLVFGLGMDDAGRLLNTLVHGVLHGSDLTAGEELSPPGWGRRLLVEQLPNPGQILYQANAYYDRPAGDSVPALQLTWTDVLGRYPWDAAYSGAPQPRPGTFTA